MAAGRRDRVSEVLLGDKSEAASWLPFAYKRLGLLRARRFKHQSEAISPAPGIMVRVKTSRAFGQVTIEADPVGLMYEFVANDLMTTLLFFPAGHALLYDLKAKRGRYLGSVSASARPFVTSKYCWTRSNGAARSMFRGDSKRPTLLTHNTQTLRYHRYLPMRMAEMIGQPGTLPRRIFYRRDAYGNPPVAFKQNLSKPIRASSPVLGLFNTLTPSVQTKADGGGRTLVKALQDWHQTASIQSVNGREFFVYTDYKSNTVKVFEAIHTDPNSATVIGSAPIPVPAWATLPEPGVRMENSHKHWLFSPDGTRMVGVLHNFTAQTYRRLATSVTMNNALDSNLRVPQPSGRAPNPGTFQQIYDNPTTVDQQVYNVIPGVLEYGIGIEFTLDTAGAVATIAVTLTKLRELNGATTGKFYVAADYLFKTDELVTLEAETWCKDGSLYSLYDMASPPLGFTTPLVENRGQDPYGVVTDAQVELLMVLHREDTPNTIVEVEQARFPIFRGRLAYQQGTILSGSAGEGYVLDESSPGTFNYLFYLGGLELRAYAWWGQAGRHDVGTPLLPGQPEGTDVHRAFLEYSHRLNPPVRKTVTDGIYPDIGLTERPTMPADFSKISAFNTVVQAVLGRCFNPLFNGDIGVIPVQDAFAVATPVVYLRCGVAPTGSTTGLYHVPAYLDTLETKKLKTTHEAVYSEIRDATEPVEAKPPLRDWTYYVGSPAPRTVQSDPGLNAFPFILNTANIATLRAGGLWFNSDRRLLSATAAR